MAFGDKFNDKDHVTLCLMGYGSTRQGTFNETFNMAMTLSAKN